MTIDVTENPEFSNGEHEAQPTIHDDSVSQTSAGNLSAAENSTQTDDQPDVPDEVQADEAPAQAAAEEAEPTPGFEALGLSEPILNAIAAMGYTKPTPIQAQAIPTVLMGRDVLGCAQTGTGKTASFTLPMLDILAEGRARTRMPRSLILEPTRELALQVADNFLKYGQNLKLTHALLIGGESMNEQMDVLAKGVDVLIATPGRLIDMFERGGLLLTDTRLLVIDEADRMLDMGFIPDIERIVGMLPQNRQTLFFSATMAPEIRRLADAFLQNPKEITVSRPSSVASTISSFYAIVPPFEKREALRWLIRTHDVQNAMIFCNRKRDVDVLYKSLLRHGFSAGGMHGDMAQSVRFATMEKFKAGELKLLVCSDVAARGIDISGLSHVFNFDVPMHAEDYVHRIGRTGRAGQEGNAFTLATPFDKLSFDAVEKLIGRPIERISIEGIDAVDWADANDRRQHGRRPQQGRRGGNNDREQKEQHRSDRDGEQQSPRRGRQNDGDRERSSDRSGDQQQQRGDRHHHGRPVDPANAAQPSGRWDRPRGGNFSRDGEQPRGPRRGSDDLGPAPIGFGDDIPAFMLLPMRRSHVAAAPAHAEADAV